MSCPYKNNKSFMSKMCDAEAKQSDNASVNDPEKGIPVTCPFSKGYTGPNPHVANTQKEEESNEKKEKMEKEKKENDEESEDEQPTGGCPVMNRVKKDPVNKHFERTYEIPRFDELDFMFDLQGALKRSEFLVKTEKLRKYPRHLKYSVFRNTDEKLMQLREKEFPIVFFIYDEIKEKGNKLYKKKKYREAINAYTYAYNTLIWLEFKDKERNKTVIASASLDPILDEEIEEKKLKVDEKSVEKDSYDASIVFLLMNLSYAYLELRHFKEALECLNECELVAGDKVADVFFRRSQVRMCNKLASEEELQEALSDIKKARNLKPDVKIYEEHEEKLNAILNNQKENDIQKLKTLLEKAQYSFNIIKTKNLSMDQVFFCNSKEKHTHYKILKEMQSKYVLAVKFFTETKNEEQLSLSYGEIERFLDVYTDFMWYYKFDPEFVNKYTVSELPSELKENLDDPLMKKLLDEFSTKLAEDIFGGGKYNFELFQYALNKICDDEKKERDLEEQRRREAEPNISYLEMFRNSKYPFYLTILFALFALGTIGLNFYTHSFKIPSANILS